MDPMGDNHGSYGSLMVNVGKYTNPMGSVMGLIPNPPIRRFPSSRQLRAGFGWRLGGPSGGSGDASLSGVVELGSQCRGGDQPHFFGWLVLMDVDVDGGWLLGDLGDSGLVSLGGKHFLGWLDGDVLVGFGLGFGVGRGVSVVFFFRWQAIFVGWMDVG